METNSKKILTSQISTKYLSDIYVRFSFQLWEILDWLISIVHFSFTWIISNWKFSSYRYEKMKKISVNKIFSSKNLDFFNISFVWWTKQKIFKNFFSSIHNFFVLKREISTLGFFLYHIKKERFFCWFWKGFFRENLEWSVKEEIVQIHIIELHSSFQRFVLTCFLHSLAS